MAAFASQDTDDTRYAAAIERVTVMLDDRLVFRFKDGTEVEG